MKQVYIIGSNIITSLGFTTDEVFGKLQNRETGIKLYNDAAFLPKPFYASLINTAEIAQRIVGLGFDAHLTKLEMLFALSITDALRQTSIDVKDTKTLLIISTTKGNIDLLDPIKKQAFGEDRLFLWKMSEVIKNLFQIENKALVVSQACISGVIAIIIGKRLIEQGTYDQVIVSGGDILTNFVLSGFESFQAISNKPCKPFDADRSGITLGEGCGTIIMTSNNDLVATDNKIIVAGGADSNDANHISGPSRTGDGLYLSIKNAMTEAQLQTIDYVSAHGTATPYNDEMEAKALAWAELTGVPVNSLKAYWGHTLGAAGIIESIAAIESMKQSVLIASEGFETMGVSNPLNIITETRKTEINSSLKTSSGFGGCNAALVLKKILN